jgi:hypothetical protein
MITTTLSTLKKQKIKPHNSLISKAIKRLVVSIFREGVNVMLARFFTWALILVTKTASLPVAAIIWTINSNVKELAPIVTTPSVVEITAQLWLHYKMSSSTTLTVQKVANH